MFAHVVHTDIHQLHRVERAASEVRCRGRMGGATIKSEIDACVGERYRLIYTRERRRVPGYCDIDITECTGPGHEAFSRAAFFCRAAVVTHPSFDALRCEVVFHRGCREHRSGTQQVVTAAMAVTVTWQRLR